MAAEPSSTAVDRSSRLCETDEQLFYTLELLKGSDSAQLGLCSRALRDAVVGARRREWWEEWCERDFGCPLDEADEREERGGEAERKGPPQNEPPGARGVAMRYARSMGRSGVQAYALCHGVYVRPYPLGLVRGSAADVADDADIVACPVVRNLSLGGPGAQMAIRVRCDRLEEEIARIQDSFGAPGRERGSAVHGALARDAGGGGGGPRVEPEALKFGSLPPTSVVVASGAPLWRSVALTVTEPGPVDRYNIINQHVQQGSAQRGTRMYMLKIMTNLLRAARATGHRRLVTPVLGTGGIGLDPVPIIESIFEALKRDYLAHPDDPIQLTIACYEVAHFGLCDILLHKIQEKQPTHLFPSSTISTIISPHGEDDRISTVEFPNSIVITSPARGGLRFQRYSESEGAVATEAGVGARAAGAVALQSGDAAAQEEEEGKEQAEGDGEAEEKREGKEEGEEETGHWTGYQIYTTTPLQELAVLCGANDEAALSMAR